MSVSLTFNPEQSRTLDRKVQRVDVNVGSLLITETDDPILVKAGEKREFDNVANLTLYSPNGAQVALYYFDEKVPATVRGDSGGQTGSFESRTTKELRSLAAERDIPGRSKMDKPELIEALRA